MLHHRRITFAVALTTSLALIIVLGVYGLSGAFASRGASLSLSPTSGAPGSTVAVTGSGFRSGETIVVTLDASQVGITQVTSSGAFSTKVTVPVAAAAGVHTIKATGQRSGKNAQATFTVSGAALADWPMYGFDATHTGFNPAEHFLSTSTVPNLSEAWTASLTGGTTWSSVAIAGGMVYAQGNELNAYNASTGALAWTDPIDGTAGPASSPAVANGVVYASSYTGTLYAVDAQTGATIWSHAISANLPSQSAIAVAEGIVYEGWDDGYLYAFNAQTGALLWSYDVATDIYTTPSVANGVVYLTAGSSLYALNATTGTVMWSDQVGSNPSTPAILNGVAYLAASGNLYAFDATSGAPLWSVATGLVIPDYCSLAVANGMIYLYSGDVYAFSVTNGALIWHSATGAGQFTPASSPVVANGVVYTGSNSSAFYAYNAQTGALLWTQSYPGVSTDMTPAVADGMFYLEEGATLTALH